MTDKKRYIPPYIEIVEEEDNLMQGMIISSEYDEDSRQAKEGYFIDDDDTSDFNWDTDASPEWEI